MNDLGKTLIVIGGLVVLTGIVVMAAGKIPGVGKLPGDMFIKKDNFTFYFPLTTCILISILISMVMHFFKRH